MLDLSFSIAELEYFLLIVVRTTGFIFAAPFFGNNSVPRTVRIGYGVLFSVLLYYILPAQTIEYHTLEGFAVIIIKETLVGLIIGYGANICSSVLILAGHLVDMESGLSMVSLMDPNTRDQTTITGMYYQYTVSLILFISGLYQFVLQALKESFTLIPINGAIFASDKMLTAILAFFRDYVILGFRICLPVFCAILLLNSILGILAKVSPQLNMFAVGIQFKVLTGIFVMFITVSMLPSVANFILTETKNVVSLLMESMM